MSSLDLVEAERLKSSNLFYRDPALYDEVQADSDSAAVCRELVGRHRPDAGTLIDFGCGTGRDLQRLAESFRCTGVELQPDLVAYGRLTRPGLDIRAGDMRTVRLDHPADVLTCLGNSLAYVHDNQDLRAVFHTFAAHARPGTLLVLCSPVAPIERAEPHTARIETRLGAADVTISYEWDLRSQINTMHRQWLFDSGERCHDTIRRRVLGPRELELYAALAGFEILDVVDETGSGPVQGPGAYVVARYRSG